MKLKPVVLQWAAVACGAVGLLYALGIEGGAQIGQPITDGEFVTAMVLILAAIALGRLSFALEDAQKQQSPYGKITRDHARNAEYPQDEERGA
jgi:hypothetical protein|nr:MAG TPA: hypothetical protein [Caudoviricetes sp.]